ncbi:MAG: hypothetical protein Q8P27_01460, partial [Candidatus Peregrinibacteria bacterium]|nr:hypothetical protein [Candidatus Peregrinibacteria bacterium]
GHMDVEKQLIETGIRLLINEYHDRIGNITTEVIGPIENTPGTLLRQADLPLADEPVAIIWEDDPTTES